MEYLGSLGFWGRVVALGRKNSGKQLTTHLKSLYARLGGELRWIENPPKLRQKNWRGGQAFAAEAAEREARAEEIRTALPHVVYVIQMFEPEWDPGQEKLIRPLRRGPNRPPPGWADAAYEVLREADDWLTVREMLDLVVERYDLKVDDGPAYVQAYGAINAALQRAKQGLVNDGGEPPRWSLRSRQLATGTATAAGEDGW